jgi:chorismate mutase
MNQDEKWKLSEMRKEVDVIDDRIVADLDRRFVLAKAIGELKTKVGLKRFDPEREREVYQRLLTVRTRLSPAALATIYQAIHAAMIEGMMDGTGLWNVEDMLPMGYALKDGDRTLLLVGKDDYNRVHQLAELHNERVRSAVTSGC